MWRPSFFLSLVLLLTDLRAALPPSSSYNYDEAKVGSIPLPPLLTARDGTVIRTAAQWTALRRPELLELLTR